MPAEFVPDDRLCPSAVLTTARPCSRERNLHNEGMCSPPQQAVAEFVTNDATQLGIQLDWLTGELLGVSDATALADDAIARQFATEKHQIDKTTVALSSVGTWRCC